MEGSPLATPQPWDLVAAAYSAEIVPHFELYARDALRLAAPPDGGRVIDVACGPGTLSLLAAQRGLAVEAVDFSPAMIAQLEARLAAHRVTAVTPRVADGQALPFADGAFDAGFSMFGLMFFPDRARGFAELRRVLAPGARAVVASWLSLDDVPAFAALFAAVREALGRLMPGGPPPPLPSFPLTTEEDCAREMGAAFERVEVHQVSHDQHHASAAALWDHMARALAPLVLLRKNLGEERWREVAATASQAVAGAVGPGPIALSLAAWLSVGFAGRS